MQLYKNDQEFRDAIIAASNYYHISPSIVENDYFKEDYETVTLVLLNENVSYEDSILAVKQIADDSLFGE